MTNLECFISCLEDTLGFFMEIWFICFIGKYLFLKDYTNIQKRRIRILLSASASSTVIYTIFIFMNETRHGAFVDHASELFDDINSLIAIASVLYTNMAGRKRSKELLSILFLIPLLGYSIVLDVIYTSILLLPLPEFYINLIRIVYDIVLLAVMFWLTSEKIRPAFIDRFEHDIKHMRYSVKEEVGVWLLGFWWFTYDLMKPNERSHGFGIFRDITPGLTFFINVMNFIFGCVITFLIINNSYRRYYYDKNIKYQKTLINTMANLVESRDENTGGHIHRTAKYSEIIARKLRKDGKFSDILTDKYIEDMIIAAPLHDVGKIHISDSVLNKPGRLDDEEFAAMKTHTAAGGEIIDHVKEEVGEEISYLSIAKEMAEYHHERMDGKGYPHGINGEQIPLCAKILAVADVFDALMSKRCYKDPMPLDKALAIIKEETGDHFDEDVSKAFLDSIDEIEQLLNEESDN